MALQRYYPAPQGDQITWLTNFIHKLPLYAGQLNLETAEIGDRTLDARYIIYLLKDCLPAVRQFSQAATRHLRAAESGDPAENFDRPIFQAPTPLPTLVPAGALDRLFDFIDDRIKGSPGYNDTLGEDLGVIGAEDTAGHPHPEPRLRAMLPEGPEFTFRKYGHGGAYIESRREGEGWAFVGIDTSSPWLDGRPLKVAGQPEWREYRFRFFDDGPAGDWSDAIRVNVGG